MDIMQWALQQQDKDGWLNADSVIMQQLITENDGGFKQALDRYKYAIRFPEQSAEDYRGQGEVFLQKLENLLSQSQFLLGNQISLADIAIFPFIRQFSGVDSIWFQGDELKVAPYPKLKIWLKTLVESELFISIMQKQPAYMT
jgi:glutathione S-transferase